MNTVTHFQSVSDDARAVKFPLPPRHRGCNTSVSKNSHDTCVFILLLCGSPPAVENPIKAHALSTVPTPIPFGVVHPVNTMQARWPQTHITHKGSSIVFPPFTHSYSFTTIPFESPVLGVGGPLNDVCPGVVFCCSGKVVPEVPFNKLLLEYAPAGSDFPALQIVTGNKRFPAAVAPAPPFNQRIPFIPSVSGPNFDHGEPVELATNKVYVFHGQNLTCVLNRSQLEN